MSHRKLLLQEIEQYSEVRTNELKLKLARLKKQSDSANPSQRELIKLAEAKVTQQLKNLTEQIHLEIADQKNHEQIRKFIQEKDKEAKKISQAQEFKDSKTLTSNLSIDPYHAEDILRRVKEQNKESIIDRTSTKAQQFHPIFKVPYPDTDKIHPTELKHPKIVEIFLTKFLLIYDAEKDKKTSKEILDQTVAMVVEEYNSIHRKKYSHAAFKYQYLADNDIGWFLEAVDPDGFLAYELDLQRMHIDSKLNKLPMIGGYTAALQSRKLDQLYFLNSILEMHQKNKKRLYECKTTVIKNMTQKFILDSKRTDPGDRMSEATHRMDAILKSKNIAYLIGKINLAHKRQSQHTEKQGDYSSTSSEGPSQSQFKKK